MQSEQLRKRTLSSIPDTTGIYSRSRHRSKTWDQI